MNNMISVFITHIRRLSHLNRCQVLPAVNRQTVAQHSYNVAMTVMLVADELMEQQGFREELTKLDPSGGVNAGNFASSALRKALIHDTEESIVGDIPWHVKHYSDESAAAFKLVAEALAEKIMPASYFSEWQCAKIGLDGSLVNLLDMVEFCMWCGDELELGNYAVYDRFDTAVNWLKKKCDSYAFCLFTGYSKTFSDFIQEVEWIYRQYAEKVENWDIDGKYRHTAAI